ncbi:hypothetical protein TNCV_4746201 [Trichonephila clavipes]|nr:hypothetical protein TNCV_4746201 [Trichonephila clavipes]
MFDPSSFTNPTPLAHADISRDALPRGGTSQRDIKIMTTPGSSFTPTPPVHEDNLESCTPELIVVPCGIKSTSKTLRHSQNTVAIILRFDSVWLALTMTGEDVCRHSIDYCFDSGLKWDTHVSSPVTIRFNMSSPSSS